MAKHIAWFSCGAASAVAAKLVVEKYGDDADVIYCDTLASEHPDNRRFFLDVERWIGRAIEIVRSKRYETVDDVFEKRRYMAGHHGAVCTTEMKKMPRIDRQGPLDVHVFGYTADEAKRAAKFEVNNPELRVEWILIDQWITKARCMEMLSASGIEPPAMYALGFDHNNCLGCVKGTSAGYWNKTRLHFPETFARRAHQSRTIGARLVRVRLPGDPPSKDLPRHFLDELPADIGMDEPDGDIECGPACQLPLDLEAA